MAVLRGEVVKATTAVMIVLKTKADQEVMISSSNGVGWG